MKELTLEQYTLVVGGEKPKDKPKDKLKKGVKEQLKCKSVVGCIIYAGMLASEVDDWGTPDYDEVRIMP